MNTLTPDASLSKIALDLEKVFRIYPNQLVLPEHLLLAILKQNSEKLKQLCQILEVRQPWLEGEVIKYLLKETVKNDSVFQDIEWHSTTDFIFSDADSIRKQLGDDAIGVEHVFCSLSRVTTTKAYEIFQSMALQADIIAEAIMIVNKSKLKNKDQANLNPTIDSGNQKKENQFTFPEELGEDVTSQAEQGKLDPVIGRDQELRRVLNILARRTKNNPVLVGEAGVGKTAIAEGLATKIARGDVPMSLRGFRLISIDVGNLVAGTGKRGQFEEKITELINLVTSSGKNIILFIDELHLLIGAGAVGDSSLDAGNMLKPYLARGQIRCIGATTYGEYSKYIEKDPALSRRFQKVVIKEPTTAEAISILRGLRDKYERFHGITIKDSALVAAAQMSSRYITDRHLPDKAVDLVDEAASRKRMEFDSAPGDLDKFSQRILHLELEKTSLVKDKDKSKQKRLLEIEKEITSLNEKCDNIKKKWAEGRESLKHLKLLQVRIDRIEREIENAKRDSDFQKAAQLDQGQLRHLTEKLESYKQNQAEKTLEVIGAKEVAKVVSEWTGIPVTDIEEDESERLINLDKELKEQVIGQDFALDTVARSIKISRTGLADAKKPIGTFLFLGPTGVGKTESAKAIARTLFNGESSMIRLDMSEYYDKYTVSRLIGAAPGYVGFEEGGQLTEAVKKTPYACILFDEIEKAHSDIYNILLQILDEGRLTDSKGKTIDFTNTVIVITSNVGADHIHSSFDKKGSSRTKRKSKQPAGKTANPKQSISDENSQTLGGGIDTVDPELKEILSQTFKPEFLNRIDDIVIFSPLKLEDLDLIVRAQINNLNNKLQKSQKEIIVDELCIEYITEKCSNTTFGARPIRRMLRSMIEAPLAEKLITKEFGKSKKVYVELDENKNFVFSKRKSKQ